MSTAAVKICFILGTRPEITKLYSIIKASYRNEEVHPLIIHTGQHYDYEMSQIFLEELELPTPHYFLDVESGTHGQMTATLLVAIEKALMKEKPDIVIVLGDTNTTMAGSLAAAKQNIPVAHIEAGCRSFDYSMPEEINRIVTDSISSLFFAPSEVAALNLLYEGKPSNRVFQAGNTVVDIVEETKDLRQNIVVKEIGSDKYDVVVTLHRQENVDDRERLKSLLEALAKIDGSVIFPMHPRTRKRVNEFGLNHILSMSKNVRVIKPLNYLAFMKLLEDASVIVTDSGGVQEEAIMLGTPCITARDTTEWPETVWAGGNCLAGLETDIIYKKCNQMIRRQTAGEKGFQNPFHGNAGSSIISIVLAHWKEDNLRMQKPEMTGGEYPLPWLLTERQELRREFQTSLQFDEKGKAIHQKSVSRVSRGYK